MLPPSRPPCEGNLAFLNPGVNQETQEAMKICETCPIKIWCAEHALTAGYTLDAGRTAPATGVIQAGVWCKGDKKTAEKLAEICRREPPKVGPKPRFKPPANCVSCGRPMTTRIKGIPLTDEQLTHGAHGYCRVCDARRRRSKNWVSKHPRHSKVLS